MLESFALSGTNNIALNIAMLLNRGKSVAMGFFCVAMNPAMNVAVNVALINVDVDVGVTKRVAKGIAICFAVCSYWCCDP